MKKQILRVVIADDSATSRLLLRKLLTADGGFEIVGEAQNGRQAIDLVKRRNPELVLLDVVMPEIDGIEAARTIMENFPRPVCLVSELVGRDANLNFKALEAGALELLRKPTIDEIEGEAGDRLRRKLRLLSEVPVITRRKGREAEHASAANPQPPPRAQVSTHHPEATRLIAIGASTGGPPAVEQILSVLAGKVRCPVVIVQHMSTGFIEGMGRWLQTTTGMKLEMARAGAAPLPGIAYLAPDGVHLELRKGFFHLSHASPERGNRPAIDRLFFSIAEEGGAAETVAALLTGMGEDGARGLSALRNSGAWTITQDEASSVVYGMPAAAAKLGAAQEILPLSEIGLRLCRLATLPETSSPC